MRRLLVVILTALVAVAVAVSAALTTSGSRAPTTSGAPAPTTSDSHSETHAGPRTEVRRVRPLTEGGRLKPRYQVTETGRGRCFWASVASQQRGAFRCMEGNGIYDPCFAASRHEVFCLDTPWTRRVIKLRVGRLPRPRNEGVSRLRRPWGMRLSDGRRCVIGTGTANYVGDTPVRYHCSRGYSTEPRTRPRRWRVRVAPVSLERLRSRRVAVALY
jgi:hypothetical protein